MITSVAFTTSIGRSRCLWRFNSCRTRTLKAHKKHADPQLARGEDRTFDFSTRGVVASHGIKSYGNHPGTSGYRLSKSGEENQAFLAFVSITSRPL